MAIPHPLQARYLYSPQNGNVMVNTELKRRMCPWAVPCNKIDASDIMDDPRITKVYSEEYDSRKAEEEALEANPEVEDVTSVEDNFKVLRLQVMSSESKDELKTIGADIDLKLTKSMNLETMRDKCLARIDEIQEASLL